jgi:Methylamine utilisation protein MauE
MASGQCEGAGRARRGRDLAPNALADGLVFVHSRGEGVVSSPSDASVQLAAEAGRFAIGTVFLFAGPAKIRRRREFVFAVMNYEPLPRRAARRVGRWLPVGEIAAAASLLLGVAIGPAAALVAAIALLDLRG